MQNSILRFKNSILTILAIISFSIFIGCGSGYQFVGPDLDKTPTPTATHTTTPTPAPTVHTTHTPTPTITPTPTPPPGLWNLYSCEYSSPSDQFHATEKWNWKDLNVMATPVVGDINGDGISDITVVGFDEDYHTDGKELVVLNGATGARILTITPGSAGVINFAPFISPAIGDIDNDGMMEIIVYSESGKKLIAYENNGTKKWAVSNVYDVINTPYLSVGEGGGIAIADLNKDGNPEIIAGDTVISNSGSILFQLPEGGQESIDGAQAYDIDRDGYLELVTGVSAYTCKGGSPFCTEITSWKNNRDTRTRARIAVGNFITQSPVDYPEIVAINKGIKLLDHQGNTLWSLGSTSWNNLEFVKPSGGEIANGGGPTVADFDGDGKREIGVASHSFYAVFNGENGSLLWKTMIKDYSSNHTSSSVFDFNGDGEAEVVYNDEHYLYIMRGIDGQILLRIPNSNGTLSEYPVIADVDNDGLAEIVISANDYAWGKNKGIRVFDNNIEGWAKTRKIWNQHSYHITNINDNGTIPINEPLNMISYNNFRQNIQGGGSGYPIRPPLVFSSNFNGTSVKPSTVEIYLGIINQNNITIPAGLAISFYDNDPSLTGAELLKLVFTESALTPYGSNQITGEIDKPISSVYYAIDDLGMGSLATGIRGACSLVAENLTQ